MKKLILLPLLAGCLSEETRIVDSWVGVYATKTYRLDEETCGPDGPEAELPSDFVAIDAIVWPDTTYMALRQCDGPESCDSAAWFEIMVDKVDEKRITGTGGTYTYMAINPELGVCTIQASSLVLTRGNEDELHVEATSYVIEEATVLAEEDCVEILEDIPDDECVGYHVIDSTRVR